jgi:hypothetical protein
VCITAGPATLSNTIVFGSRAQLDGRMVHVLGYQNEAQDHTNRPNAMILPIPSATQMGPDNMVDTRPFAGFLKAYAEAIRPRDRGMTRGSTPRGLVSLGVQVFERGSYTVVLACNANVTEIRRALDALPEGKRPAISDGLIESFAKLYPGWHLAICCWSGHIKPEPLLWWYEPVFNDVFLPGLDAHDGGPPDLLAHVSTDHTLVVGYAGNRAPSRSIPVGTPRGLSDFRPQGPGEIASPGTRLHPDAAQLMPTAITGEVSVGRLVNGDWWADESGVISRRSAGTRKRIDVPTVEAYAAPSPSEAPVTSQPNSMREADFFLWLQGFFDLATEGSDDAPLLPVINVRRAKCILRHAGLVRAGTPHSCGQQFARIEFLAELLGDPMLQPDGLAEFSRKMRACVVAQAAAVGSAPMER